MADRINADINRVRVMPDVQERLAQVGAEDGGGSRQRYADFTRAEREKYAQVIRQAGIQPEG